MAFGTKPQLEHQGSEAFLKKQFKFCQKGELGYFSIRQVVSYLPDTEERTTKRQKKSIVGLLLDEEDEERSVPTTSKQAEHMHQVFYTNLLMCTAAFPQFKHFDINLDDMQTFYRWLHGPSIANRKPPPSVGVLMRAERMAWREVAKLVHLGRSTKQALTEVKQDLL